MLYKGQTYTLQTFTRGSKHQINLLANKKAGIATNKTDTSSTLPDCNEIKSTSSSFEPICINSCVNSSSEQSDLEQDTVTIKIHVEDSIRQCVHIEVEHQKQTSYTVE
jgi:hypothetical protein